MKRIAEKILIALVALLLLAVPFAVAWGITHGMNNGTKMMTLAEARALVAKVNAAYENRGSNQLLTAAIENYEYDYIRPEDAGGDSCQLFLMTVSYMLDDAVTEPEGYLKSMIDEDVLYVGYILQENSVRFISKDLIDNRSFNEIIITNDDDNKWTFIYSVFTNQDRYVLQIINGNDTEMKQMELHDVSYSNELTVNNITSIFYGYIDANRHERLGKGFGNISSIWEADVENITETEIDQEIAYFKNYLEKAWNPNFTEKEFKDSNFLIKLQEWYQENFN